MDQIIQLDFGLFHLINEVWIHPFLDRFMPFMRNQYLWAPLYVFLIAFLAFHFGKRGWFYAFFAILIVLGSNYLSSEVIKKNTKRIRPCNELSLEGHRRSLVRCGSGYSFTSSHAANHFCLAGFLFFSGSAFIGRWRYFVLIWAAIIAYAQVYVGVHYPIDVIGGSLLGLIAGLTGAFVYKKLTPRL